MTEHERKYCNDLGYKAAVGMLIWLMLIAIAIIYFKC